MCSDSNILQNIPDGKPVRIYLPLLNRPDRIRIQGLYQVSKPPRFSLIFKPGIIPVANLDTKAPCVISIDMGGPTISLEALIHEVVNQQKLDMIARKSVNHEQLREFFRVDAVTSVISKSYQPEHFAEKVEPWSIAGHTVDLSGSGILAIFDQMPQPDQQVKLKITIPLPEPEIITVLAHQRRMRQLHDGRFEVAYHFDDISVEDRDKIIGCCLVIQRKMLRLKVTVNE